MSGYADFKVASLLTALDIFLPKVENQTASQADIELIKMEMKELRERLPEASK